MKHDYRAITHRRKTHSFPIPVQMQLKQLVHRERILIVVCLLWVR